LPLLDNSNVDDGDDDVDVGYDVVVFKSDRHKME